jgi:hypothetical protein
MTPRRQRRAAARGEPVSARRRALLRGTVGLAALCGLPAPAARARPAAAATFLVPGPENGLHERWSSRLAAFLGRGASTALDVTCTVLGGPDGVTAANRFATQVEPDGRTLLVLSGGAAQARLVGDPRARFDTAGWLPVCAAEGLAVVVGRADPATFGTVRLALASADSPAAAALCALGMMGLDAVPVPALGPLQAEAALLSGSVDAMLLHGPEVPARLSALPARPWFTLDASGARDAALPEVPCMSELVSGPTVLRIAAQAAAAAARLHAALVLPALTPADRVALWRGAAARWQDEEARPAAASGLRPLSGPEAAPLLSAAFKPPPEAALAYRDWLLRRLHWRAA